MQKVYVPFHNNEPASVEINGHRLVIVCTESGDVPEDPSLLGGAEIREVDLADEDADQSETLLNLAAEVNSGVVITPPGISAEDLIANLRQELPWVH